MIVFLVSFVFAPEFFELLNDLVIFADLLIDGKQHGIERKHSKERGPGGLLPSGSYRQESSGKGWDSVGPGLDRGADSLVRVGREGDPGTAEGQHIQFAIGVMTPER